MAARTLIRGRVLACATLVACVVLIPTQASAQAQPPAVLGTGPGPVIVIVPPICAAAASEFAGLWDHLRVELMAAGASWVVMSDFRTIHSDAVVALAVEPCDERPREVVVAISLSTGAASKRTISIDDIDGRERPRLLALAIAEFMRNAWLAPPSEANPLRIEKSNPLPALASPTGASVPAAAPEPSAAMPSAGPLVGAALELRAFPTTSVALLGGRVFSSFQALPPIRIRLDAGGGASEARVPLGTIDLSLLSAGLGVHFATLGKDLHLEMGPRLEVGYARVSGRPSVGATGSAAEGAVVMGGVDGAIFGRLGSSWRTWLEMEVGQTLYSLDALADGRPTAGLAGTTFAARLGIAFQL